MSLYLNQNGSQTGPFTEDQVRQMLQGGMVTPETLAWREGMPNWQQLSLFPSFQMAGVPMGTPARKGSMLGMISFGFSLLSAVGWIALLVVAGAVHNAGAATEGFNVLVGIIFMVGILFNFIGIVLGVIGVFQSGSKVFPILGACINGFLLVGLFALVCLGISMEKKEASGPTHDALPQPTNMN